MGKVALTLDFKETVVARARSDGRFRDAMFAEAINACLGGDTQAGKAMLRDLVNAIIRAPRILRHGEGVAERGRRDRRR